MVKALGQPIDNAELLGARLQQIDALLSCLNMIMSSDEASLHTQHVLAVIGLSRELVEDAGHLQQMI